MRPVEDKYNKTYLVNLSDRFRSFRKREYKRMLKVFFRPNPDVQNFSLKVRNVLFSAIQVEMQ